MFGSSGNCINIIRSNKLYQIGVRRVNEIIQVPSSIHEVFRASLHEKKIDVLLPKKISYPAI